MNSSFIKVRTKGFSLTELMVAMTIGLIVMAAAATILVNSQKNYVTQDSLARLQENARFAMGFLIKDIRRTGYFGCASKEASDPNKIINHLAGPIPPDANYMIPIEGWQSGTAQTWLPSGDPLGVATYGISDAIRLRSLDPDNPVTLLTDMPRPSADLKLTVNSGYADGDILMITDCKTTEVIQVTNITTGNPWDNVVHNTGNVSGISPGNASMLNKAYTAGTSVLKVVSTIYYIGTGSSGQPALFRKKGSAAAQELVEGIENLQVLYGVDDTFGDRVPHKYVTANNVTNWANVVSLRVGILARTLANKTMPNQAGKDFGTDIDTKSYDVDGDGVNETLPANDRYTRHVFSSTVVLRNLK